MNLLARKTDYAVRALVYMAGKPGQRVSTTDVYRDLGLPRPFIRGIFQVLQKEGYLESVKGLNGGFSLARPADKIRLADLMALFQGDFSMGDCLFRKKICSCAKTCPLRHEIKTIEDMARKHLDQVTIASLTARGRHA